MATEVGKNEINIDAIWPVGAIYMSAVSTNPSSYFGGTWTAFGAGRVPVGVDAAQTEFDTVEETGGAKTHTLTTAEMPSHAHALGNHGTSGSYGHLDSGTASSSGAWGTEAAGGGGAHNNLQPYITVYMWKRTA